MSWLNAALLLALGAIWGGSFLFLRVAAPVFGAIPLIATRVTLAAATLVPVLALSRTPLGLRARWRQYLVLGVLNGTLPFTLIAAAVIHLNAAISSILNATTPLFTAIAVALWERRRPPARVLAGVVMGLAGVVVLMGWSPVAPGPRTALSTLAALTAAASYGAGAMYARRVFREVPALSVATGQLVGATLFMLPLGLVFRPSSVPPLLPVLAALALAVVCTSLANVIYFRLIATAGATPAATVTFLVPLFSLLWGVFLLGEPTNPAVFAGLGLILASVWLVMGVKEPTKPVR